MGEVEQQARRMPGACRDPKAAGMPTVCPSCGTSLASSCIGPKQAAGARAATHGRASSGLCSSPPANRTQSTPHLRPSRPCSSSSEAPGSRASQFADPEAAARRRASSASAAAGACRRPAPGREERRPGTSSLVASEVFGAWQARSKAPVQSSRGPQARCPRTTRVTTALPPPPHLRRPQSGSLAALWLAKHDTTSCARVPQSQHPHTPRTHMHMHARTSESQS